VYSERGVLLPVLLAQHSAPKILRTRVLHERGGEFLMKFRLYAREARTFYLKNAVPHGQAKFRILVVKIKLSLYT
jgi:hypothetical protein